MDKEEILSRLRELKPALMREFAVRQIGLFGSFAAGNPTESSDIDLLVELQRPIGWKFFSLELLLERIFNRKIDLVTKNAIKEEMKDRILNEVHYV
jgi:uncharacterized protein